MLIFFFQRNFVDNTERELYETNLDNFLKTLKVNDEKKNMNYTWMKIREREWGLLKGSVLAAYINKELLSAFNANEEESGN